MANPDHVAKLKEGVIAWNKWREDNPDVVPDLSDASLEKFDLGSAETNEGLLGINLMGAMLNRANLGGVNLKGANLEGVMLLKADLRKAVLIQANLTTAHLRGVWFQKSNLKEADLTKAFLRGAKFEGADLSNTNFEKANLEYAHFEGTDVTTAHFEGTDLRFANLAGVNLSGKDLKNIIFKGANLEETDLSNTHLEGADFSNTNCRNAKFASSRIEGAQFRGADLWYADFTESIGLLDENLAGANLTKAELPKGVGSTYPVLDRIEEISKYGRQMFFMLASACVLCWLTMVSTTDVDLWIGSAITPIPVIQTKVSIWFFFGFVPAFLLIFYVYFHTSLRDLWTGLGSLPALFTDGTRLDQRAFPWMLNSLVQAHVPLLKTRRPPYSQIYVTLAIIGAWAMAPLTIFSFWLRYIPARGWTGTCYFIALGVLITCFAIHSYILVKQDLSGLTWQKADGESRIKSRVLQPRSFVVIILAVLLWAPCAWFSYIVIEIQPDWRKTTILWRTIPDFTKAQLSQVTKHYTYSQAEKGSEERFGFIGAVLRNARLRYARAEGAFLAEADLHKADLSKANLKLAALGGANLNDANLKEANLTEANLQKATLKEANLTGAVLSKAKLHEANLSSAIIQNGNFEKAKLRKAILIGAILKNAKLVEADLQEVQLSKAQLQHANLVFANIQKARLLGARLQHANLSGADLKEAKMFFANLKNANLSRAKLHNANFDITSELEEKNVKLLLYGLSTPAADFSGAQLFGADLSGASLQTVQNLTQKQLDEACGDDKTKLPKGLTIKPCSSENYGRKEKPRDVTDQGK